MTKFFEFVADVDTPRLHSEVFGSGLGDLLEGVSQKGGNFVSIAMNDSITAPQEATLTGVVLAHINIPLPIDAATSGVYIHSINGLSGLISLEQVDGTVEFTPSQTNANEGCLQIRSRLPGASGELLSTLGATVNAIQASGGGVFGQGLIHVEDNATFSTSSNGYQQALLLTTPSLEAGDYYISWSFESFVEDNDDLRNTHRVRLNDTETLALHTVGLDDKMDWKQVSGFAIRTLTAGVHTVDIDIRRGSDKSTQIRRRRLVIWRVA